MKQFKLFTLLCLLFALNTVSGQVIYASSIASHRAFYEMEVGRVEKNATIQTVAGRSAFFLEKDCDGWRSSEDYMIEFGNVNGRVDRILSRFESWESDKGDQYSFDILEKSSFQDEKDLKGYAQLNHNGGEAVFFLEGESSLSLPQNTYFPMQHVRAIIEKAGEGGKILSASL